MKTNVDLHQKVSLLSLILHCCYFFLKKRLFSFRSAVRCASENWTDERTTMRDILLWSKVQMCPTQRKHLAMDACASFDSNNAINRLRFCRWRCGFLDCKPTATDNTNSENMEIFRQQELTTTDRIRSFGHPSDPSSTSWRRFRKKKLLAFDREPRGLLCENSFLLTVRPSLHS